MGDGIAGQIPLPGLEYLLAFEYLVREPSLP